MSFFDENGWLLWNLPAKALTTAPLPPFHRQWLKSPVASLLWAARTLD